MSKQADDYMIYDTATGDLLEGPMSYEHARYLVDRNEREAGWADRDGRPRVDIIAMARRGEMRGIQAGFARQMSGNPPRDLRR